jgi:hypothetical protein
MFSDKTIDNESPQGMKKITKLPIQGSRYTKKISTCQYKTRELITPPKIV